VNDDQRSCRRAHSEEDEPILFLRVFWIMEQARMRVVENALCLFKPNSMLGPIASVFPFVSIEPEHV